MSLTYPLSIPNSRHLKKMTPKTRSMVGVSESPFTFEQQAYVHQGQKWAFDVELIPMERATAAAWLAFLVGLNGREGTFYLGDPKGAAPQGTWTTGVLVDGASQTGRSLNVRAAAPFATGKAGDYFQLSTGYLHMLTKDVTFDSNGTALLDFWPRLRASPADGDALTLLNPVCLCRLESNENQWTMEELMYGLSFSCAEAL